MKRILLAAILLSTASLAFKYEFCMDGPGYGLPLAVLHPAHEDHFVVAVRGNNVDGTVLDFPNLGVNVVAWALVSLGGRSAWRARRRVPPN
jgi:hypothetical protein